MHLATAQSLTSCLASGMVSFGEKAQRHSLDRLSGQWTWGTWHGWKTETFLPTGL